VIPACAESGVLWKIRGCDGGAPQTCQGGAGHNGWYGSGEVDALKAVG